MRVEIEIPGPVWWILGGKADQENQLIGDLVQRGILHVLGEDVKRLNSFRDRRASIITLAQEGHTDAVIAERTGELRQYIQQVRAGAGIKPNRPGQVKSLEGV